jgi:hypothetical protein
MIVEAPWIGAGSAVELLKARHYCGRHTALLWLQRWYENGEIHGRPCGPLAAKCASFRERGLWTAADDAKAFRDASNAHLLSDAHVLDSLWEFDRAHVVAKCQGLAQEGAGQFEAEANAAPVLSYASLRHFTPTAATALLTWGDEALARRYRGAMLMCAHELPGTEAYADMPFGDDRAAVEHEWRVAHGKSWREAQDRLSQAIADGQVRVHDGEGPRLLLAPATMEDIEARGYFVNREDVLRLVAASGTGGDAEVDLKPQPADMPPEATLPWAVRRIMEELAYPPDRAWSLLHRATRTGELTPRRGKLSAPGRGPKLAQWERDNLDFDLRRYQDDAQSGAPCGSLFIGRESVHPHAITVPAEEVEHWLGLQAAPDDLTIECDAANFTPAGVVIATEVPGSTVKPEDGQLTPASENAIREAVREGYRTNDRPNVNELVPLVQRALKKSGKKASKVQIQKIAVEREFAAQRRRQGEHRPRRPRSTLDNT